MSFIELARARYSSRSYREQPVEEEKIMKVLEAGRIAPSACNLQPWYFVVVRDPESRNNFNKAYHREWFAQAPVAIVVCGDHSKSWKRKDAKDHCDIDAAIATDHMTLQATELGLATCWICNFDKEVCSELLKLPDNIEPVAILSLGYPADSSDPARHSEKRKLIEDIVRWERFS